MVSQLSRVQVCAGPGQVVCSPAAAQHIAAALASSGPLLAEAAERAHAALEGHQLVVQALEGGAARSRGLYLCRLVPSASTAS